MCRFIIAASTTAGLEPLWWYRMICSSDPSYSASDFIFCDEVNTKWTSASFRTTYLYPCLSQLKAAGDPYLIGLDSLSAAFWSLHCYRRSARTHVDQATFRGIRQRFRRSLDAMIYEHGRWSLRRSSLPIDAVYREWSPRDRILITQLFF